MKLKIGEKIPNFKYKTALQSNLKLYNNINRKNIVIFFLRYYGCTICQLDLKNIENNIEEFNNNNIEVKVVLQSDTNEIKKQLKKNPLSYEIICDPSLELYNKFEINPAKNEEEIIGGNTPKKIKKAKRQNIKHGKYEGEELQLPAVFIMNKKGIINYSYYGKNAADIPSPKETLILTKWLNNAEIR
jgi:peroxiredoxin